MNTDDGDGERALELTDGGTNGLGQVSFQTDWHESDGQ
jgi:hypothetical protein